MPLSLFNLDESTRQFMLEEIERDIEQGALYISPRLSATGRNDYPALLQETVKHHDDAWLANNLRLNGRMNIVEERRKPKGGTTMASIPVTAPDTLAEGEFNRFYIRGLCKRAIATGVERLVIYRAKEVSSPRPESQAKVGTAVDPQRLLDDLRASIGVDTALGLPSGPNSGLSAKLP
jgi:hypothetical protein